jgi:hypothetical protein
MAHTRSGKSAGKKPREILNHGGDMELFSTKKIKKIGPKDGKPTIMIFDLQTL